VDPSFVTPNSNISLLPNPNTTKHKEIPLDILHNTANTSYFLHLLFLLDGKEKSKLAELVPNKLRPKQGPSRVETNDHVDFCMRIKDRKELIIKMGGVRYLLIEDSYVRAIL
jgi:hypothetical protein